MHAARRVALGVRPHLGDNDLPMDIALLTYAGAPALPPDDQLLLAPLRARGLNPHPVIWDAPDTDWSRFRLAVVRGIWDYFVKPQAYAQWLQRVEPQVELFNPVRLLKWNGHKAYLVELAQAGLSVTPTRVLRQGAPASLAAIADAQGWESVVVKPAISGAGRLTQHFSRPDHAHAGQAHLEAVLREGDALVQPFLPALHEEGERSYVFIDGVFSHAVDRAATMGAEVIPDGTAMAPRADELQLAQRILRAAPTPTLYARVDVATGPEGAPMLQELEVIEPRLFFSCAPESAERMADAVLARARR
jgi:hypothetical protein